LAGKISLRKRGAQVFAAYGAFFADIKQTSNFLTGILTFNYRAFSVFSKELRKNTIKSIAIYKV
jgi:hypothetical protein